LELINVAFIDKSYPYMGVIASGFPYFFTASVYPL
jgi:hypothetical protein